MNKHIQSDEVSSQENKTPGRPKPSGSRQQTRPGQNAQTGSHKTDDELTRRTGSAAPLKPPGAK
jgi:hypothetical protein